MSQVRIFPTLTRIINVAKKNNRCLEELSKIKERKTIFIETTDTNEKCYFMVDNGQIIGPFRGDPAEISVKIEANTRTLLDIWLGKIDPDAAWLFRKVRVEGSFLDATRIKNLFELLGEDLVRR